MNWELTSILVRTKGLDQLLIETFKSNKKNPKIDKKRATVEPMYKFLIFLKNKNKIELFVLLLLD